MTTQISVIVPVYNSEKTLEKCVSSIISQTFPNFELILVDDGSIDSSPLMCDRLAEKDNRISVIHKKNGGVSSARNVGLDAARFNWITFIDSDDTIPENSLELLVGGIQTDTETWLSIGGFSVYGLNGNIVSDCLPCCEGQFQSLAGFFDSVYRGDKCLFRGPYAKLFRKTSLRFEETLKYGEDMVFVTDYLANVPEGVSCSVVKSSIYNYYPGPNGLGGDLVSDRHLEQLFVLIPRYSESIEHLLLRIPDSKKANDLYHKDIVGRYCCRILNIFAATRTELLTKRNISTTYSIMSRDKRLNVFSLRIGQVPNIILYKIGIPAFTTFVYKITRAMHLNNMRRHPFL